MGRFAATRRKVQSLRQLLLFGVFFSAVAVVFAQVDESFISLAVPVELPDLERAESSEPMDVSGAIKLPSVYFIEPKDGAIVPREVKLKLGIQGGLKVEKAGEVVPGEGHFHVLIDTPPIARGKVIPTDAKHIHFLDGATEGTIKLLPGKHKLTLLFGTGTHVSYGEMMSQTIEVRVK